MEESEGKEEREEAEVVGEGEGEAEVEAVELLRPLMRAHTPALEALVVPSEDAHQSEYVADADKRREFVSGFSGSAGVAVITGSRALLWTDGRYFLQAQQQLSSAWQLMRGGEEPPLEAWLADHLPRGAGVGVDPWCISVDSAKRWEHVFARRGLKLVPLQRNLVDQVWKARPRPALAPVRTHAVAFAGRPARDKLHDLRQALAKERASAILVTTLDEVAWLYNLRGSDVLYNPVVHAFAIVTAHAAFYYVDRRKIDEVVEHYLLENGVEIRDYDRMLPDVEELGKACAAAADPEPLEPEPADASAEEEVEEEDDHDSSNAPTLVWLDPASCSYALYARLPQDRVLLQQSPLALAKALKHPVELQGMRNSHIRDGAAVVCHTAWLDRQMQEVYGAAGYFAEGNDGKGSLKRKRSDKEKLTEISVSDKLEEFRSKRDLFKGLSFDTISAVGANAAIIHYSAVPHSCAEMQPDAMYLCDSGGQYLDGTTDITRTMHFGKPSAHEMACYTRVLKAHIGLDTAVFPNGTTGHALDILARLPLWKDGLDYRHGTGHGVGSYLNVHEGPHLISFRPQARNVSLQANMTVTDEPGYYEEGNFGIRIENVLIIKEAEVKHNFGEKGYLGFEHITWVPYQQKLMDVSLLTPEEISWIDKYHLDCRKVLAPHLSGDDLDWLVQATNPLSASA